MQPSRWVTVIRPFCRRAALTLALFALLVATRIESSAATAAPSTAPTSAPTGTPTSMTTLRPTPSPSPYPTPSPTILRIKLEFPAEERSEGVTALFFGILPALCVALCTLCGVWGAVFGGLSIRDLRWWRTKLDHERSIRKGPAAMLERLIVAHKEEAARLRETYGVVEADRKSAVANLLTAKKLSIALQSKITTLHASISEVEKRRLSHVKAL